MSDITGVWVDELRAAQRPLVDIGVPGSHEENMLRQNLGLAMIFGNESTGELLRSRIASGADIARET